MEDKKIKSALELAMEKIAKMPRLTPEEVGEQQEREYRPRGKAIADRFLGKTLREADLEIELGKYQGREGEIIRKALLSTLCQSIGFEDMEKSRRAIEGIQAVETKAHLQEIKREVERISSEFHRERKQKYTMLEELEKGKLRALGISGSAIKPSLKEKEDWQHELREMQLAYDLRMSKLKEKLSHYIGS